MPLPKENERFTYQDYVTWPGDERWELIDGVPYNMTPSPKTRHQDVQLNFSFIVIAALKGKPCKPYIPPMDVVLSEHDVVQPDFFVVCDKSKITEANIQGAPDLIVEVLSPSTSKKDQREKKRLYARYGVKEYILIDPEAQYVNRFWLCENGKYDEGEILDAEQKLILKSLPEIEVDLAEVFEVELETPAKE